MDEELWNELRGGDREALRKIYLSNIDDLLQYGHRFSSSSPLVEDCIHDLFVYLWKTHANLGTTTSIKMYLLVALRRKIIRQLNTEMSRAKNQPISFEASLTIEEHWISNEESDEKKDSLRQAFSKLSDRQKEVIYLRYYEGLSYESICQVMDISYQSVRNLVSGSIQSMRKIMVCLYILLFCISMSTNA